MYSEKSAEMKENSANAFHNHIITNLWQEDELQSKTIKRRQGRIEENTTFKSFAHFLKVKSAVHA